MPIKKIIIGALPLAMLVGCASNVWYKPGGLNNELHMDSGQCQAQAYSAPASYPGQAQRVYDGCMKGKGWALVPAETIEELRATEVK